MGWAMAMLLSLVGNFRCDPRPFSNRSADFFGFKLTVRAPRIPSIAVFFPLSTTACERGGPPDSPTENLVIGGGSHDEFVAFRPGGEKGLEQGAHAVETGRVEALRVLLGPPEAEGGDVIRIRVREQHDLVDEARRRPDDLRDRLIADGVDQGFRLPGLRGQLDDMAVHGCPLLSPGCGCAPGRRRPRGARRARRPTARAPLARAGAREHA